MIRKWIYRTINRLGYRIERKRTREELWENYKLFEVKENLDLFFESKIYIERLALKFKNLKLTSHKLGFIVHFLNFNIYVETAEEFFILEEIFVSNDYFFNTSNNAVVIDVGANIGISSLFFSSLSNVESIYAFEPVNDTYNQALLNFELNKSMHKVVSIKNIGLGAENREEIFVYNKQQKGNTGKRGLLSPSMSNRINEKRAVSIIDASLEISSIVSNSVNNDLVLKMDCEGAEYEILENLDRSGVLKQLDIVMLEWHDHGPDKLENILIKNSFQLFSRNLNSHAGLIYGVKNLSK